MKEGYTIRYFNEYFLKSDIDYNYLKVINRTEPNQIHMVWWDDKEYKHPESVGQWKIKHLKI